ncbi:MAG: PAS domain-containing protein [Bradyrhizobium sp.]
MNHLEFQLRGVGDPRLAVHATSALPAWLWSVDGTRILWANPVGARLFGAANGAVLSEKTFGPADSHRRQVAQLANRLPPNGALRLERLRGFGATLGTLVTCGCARLDFADGSHGVLIAAAEPVGRSMPLVERLQRLVEGIDTPIAAFARDGMFIGASDAARSLLGFRDLSEAGLGEAQDEALKQGRVELPVGIGHLVLQRVGSGADVGLVALIATGAATAAQAEVIATPEDPNGDHKTPDHPTPDDEASADSEASAPTNEALAGFAMVDEFAEPLTETVEAAPVEPVPAEPESLEPKSVESESVDPVSHPAPDYEAPAMSGEAPAEFALVDELTSQPQQPGAEQFLETPEPMIAVHQDEAVHSDEPAHRDEPSPQETPLHEPSPYVEAVADEPSPETAPIGAEESAPVHDEAIEPPPWHDESPPPPRSIPLRFMWQMDAEGRFSLGSDEFNRLIGSHTAASFGRLWSDIAASFALDPEGRVLKAVATHDTWSGITLNWPVDGGGRLPVELSGLPILDRERNFAGYRGFGVCRDLDGLSRLEALRRYELFNPPAPPTRQALSAQALSADVVAPPPPELPATIASETSQPTDLETPVEPPKNILQFRPIDPKAPVLTPVENNAFNELARQLAERLERENGIGAAPQPEPTPGTPEISSAPEAIIEAPAAEKAPEVNEQPGWLTRPEPPPRGESRRDKALLDLLPVGVLIYRLDRLLYANAAFLRRMGYASLHALEEAGGLDALYVEPGVSSASSTSDTGTPVTISATQAAPEHTPPASTQAHLYTIEWDDEQALALIFSASPVASSTIAAALTAPAIDDEADNEPVVMSESVAASEPSPVGHANAEELAAILDTTAEGILMFDAEGNINSCNRSAEALFGYDGNELVQHNLTDLFAPESAPAVRDYLQSVEGADISSLLEQGRDLLARVSSGGLIPVSMTMGRTQAHGPNFFAVFRDLSQSKNSESELREARRLADRAANAKGDMLARISHEVRTPLNAIIGFAEVMIGERFGALGNERYVEYMKDIRASGERVIAIINDLLDLSRIETGKLDLAFTNQNLNDLVEQCVAVMQPQANRERIIIRTSLAHMLPPVMADARALRQITLNLIGNSIHLANAGGQVIVSTALSDRGEVVLRVRDTGHGLNDNEVAAAMEPFRTGAPTDQASDSSGVSLSLTKALVEANRAQFQIKTGGHSGTLIEVLFPHAMARA